MQKQPQTPPSVRFEQSGTSKMQRSFSSSIGHTSRLDKKSRPSSPLALVYSVMLVLFSIIIFLSVYIIMHENNAGL